MLVQALIAMASVSVANYGMNRGRTSDLVKSASGVLTVDDAGDGSYRFNVHYDLKTYLGQSFRGDRAVTAPQTLFTWEFMDWIRINGVYEDDRVRVEHLSQDADCDRLSMIDKSNDTSGDVDDMRGKWRGQVVKLGLDKR